jgi:serine/threonine-protein kinase
MPISSAAELLDWLGQNQFLAPEQVGALRPQLGDFTDAHALARDLIRRDWLTPYQVNQIFQGKQDQLIFGNYRLRERLGEGAMGQVFKAWNPRTLRVVAVKTLHKDLVKSAKAMDRFRREMATAAQLEHPNIAHVRDADEVDGKPYMVMEFIEGFNLAQRVKQSGPLPVVAAVEYVRQAALGLQHAFERGIVHRDIKPANLIVTMHKGNGEGGPLVKILDFGLARFDSESDEAGRLTQVGRLLGTIDYVAPEQAQDARSADIRADIYSLGCTLYWLLAGVPPFPGETLVEKLSPRVTGEPPWIRSLRPEAPPLLEQVLRKMMARLPADRYQTPLEAAQALEPFTRATAAPAGGVIMAMPVEASQYSGPAPLAEPVGEATLPTLELPPGLAAPVAGTALPAPGDSVEPVFVGMSATGRDPSTGKTATPRPQQQAGSSHKLLVILGGAGAGLVLIAGLIGLLLLFLTPSRKKGSIVILPDTKFANPNNIAKPGNNRVLVHIKRVDFTGPVTATLKDLPDDVNVQVKTVPANMDKFEVIFKVSFGARPVTKQIRLVVEYEPDGIVEELPMTLTVVDSAGKNKN